MSARERLRLAGFFARLALKEHALPELDVRPLVAELFLTENCNLRCVSCACWREWKQGELSTEEWKDVLGQLRRLDFHKVNFTGGEPLIRRDAVALMEHARSLGIAHLHLNTNAILLTPARRERVLAAGVRSFNVSVDGPRELHDRIRGREGAFARTLAHLRGLLERRDELGLKVRLSFTVMRDTARALPRMAELAQELGVRLTLNLATDQTFLFRDPEVSRQTAVDEQALLASLRELERMVRRDPANLPRPAELRYVPRHFSDIVQRDLPCAESQLKLLVHADGQVGGCWGHDGSFNVRQTPVAEVLASPAYREQQARLFRKDCAGCGANYLLNLRWRPRTYVEDARWRLRREPI